MAQNTGPPSSVNWLSHAAAPMAPSIALSHGVARELRKHVAIIEREIAELTKAGMT